MSFRFFKRKQVMNGALVLGAIDVIGGALHPVRKVSATTAAVAPVVEVTQAEQENVPVYGEWIDTLDGSVNADVRAQVRISLGRVTSKATKGLQRAWASAEQR
jgi:hypothetical protein